MMWTAAFLLCSYYLPSNQGFSKFVGIFSPREANHMENDSYDKLRITMYTRDKRVYSHISKQDTDKSYHSKYSRASPAPSLG